MYVTILYLYRLYERYGLYSRKKQGGEPFLRFSSAPLKTIEYDDHHTGQRGCDTKAPRYVRAPVRKRVLCLPPFLLLPLGKFGLVNFDVFAC